MNNAILHQIDIGMKEYIIPHIYKSQTCQTLFHVYILHCFNGFQFKYNLIVHTHVRAEPGIQSDRIVHTDSSTPGPSALCMGIGQFIFMHTSECLSLRLCERSFFTSAR
jgi:hypothetical protein